MNYGLITVPTLTNTECLIIGINGQDLPESTQTINTQQKNLFAKLSKNLKNPGDMTCHLDTSGCTIIIIQCGEKSTYAVPIFTKCMTDISGFLLKQRIQSAVICMPQLVQHTANWQLQQMIMQIEAQRYQLLTFKSTQNQPHALNCIKFVLPNASSSIINIAQTIAAGVCFARDLANSPANICTPSYIAQEAIKLAHENTQIQTNVLDADAMRAMGMGSLLAVAQGSHQPPKLVEVHYHGADKTIPPVILVGKGITFDSGGISLKPADGMNEMKFDMAGAASVLGTLKACAELKLPLNIIGLLACAENMPGGGAIKPGDVVTSLSGQTIEIINTDAEGRLVLADALTYAERFNPSIVIDIATLTGAVIIALGNISTGLMSEDDDLANLILKAAKTCDDKAWRLPLDAAYQEALDSPIADMVNSSFERTAGSITAACFLSRFTSKYRWAHLDIAGTAWISGKKRNATGRPVPLLVQFLQDLSNAS